MYVCILSNRFIALVLFSIFHLNREFVKGVKTIEPFLSGWPGLIGKCCYVFHRVFPLVSGIMESTPKYSRYVRHHHHSLIDPHAIRLQFFYLENVNVYQGKIDKK